MNAFSHDLDRALDDVSASSAGGSPFLLSYGLTFFACALLSLFIPVPTVALIAMFQGAVALPLAFFLERRMGSKRMEPGNPLRPLSGQMAVSQGLALPALIAIYSLDPALIPLGLASVGGVHFLPYAWLHRTRIYIYLAATLSVGALLLQLFLTGAEFTVILFFIAITYWATVLPTFRHAARLVAKMGIQGGAQ